MERGANVLTVWPSEALCCPSVQRGGSHSGKDANPKNTLRERYIALVITFLSPSTEKLSATGGNISLLQNQLYLLIQNDFLVSCANSSIIRKTCRESKSLSQGTALPLLMAVVLLDSVPDSLSKCLCDISNLLLRHALWCLHAGG